jgi:hypothetical protein
MHTRALIRHACVRVIRDFPDVKALMDGRVWPDRSEHWLADELPACGVYTLSEQTLESDISPDPEERRIDLAIEILARLTTSVDDALDALCLAVEKAMRIDAVGIAMGAIADAARIEAGLAPLAPVRVDGALRHTADVLLRMELQSTEIGIAVEGDREIGVAVLTYALEYRRAYPLLVLPDFLLAASGWDVMPADGRIDMVSKTVFTPGANGVPPTTTPDTSTPQQTGIPDAILDHLDEALRDAPEDES